MADKLENTYQELPIEIKEEFFKEAQGASDAIWNEIKDEDNIINVVAHLRMHYLELHKKKQSDEYWLKSDLQEKIDGLNEVIQRKASVHV